MPTFLHLLGGHGIGTLVEEAGRQKKKGINSLALVNLWFYWSYSIAVAVGVRGIVAIIYSIVFSTSRGTFMRELKSNDLTQVGRDLEIKQPPPPHRDGPLFKLSSSLFLLH